MYLQLLFKIEEKIKYKLSLVHYFTFKSLRLHYPLNYHYKPRLKFHLAGTVRRSFALPVWRVWRWRLCTSAYRSIIFSLPRQRQDNVASTEVTLKSLEGSQTAAASPHSNLLQRLPALVKLARGFDTSRELNHHEGRFSGSVMRYCMHSGGPHRVFFSKEIVIMFLVLLSRTPESPSIIAANRGSLEQTGLVVLLLPEHSKVFPLIVCHILETNILFPTAN